MSKSRFKKLFFNTHLYLSLPFGIVISLICFSGAMLALEKHITPHMQSHLLYVSEAKGERLPLDTLVSRVQSTLPDSVRVTSVSFYPDPKRTFQFHLSKPRKASLYADPYSGEVLGKGGKLPFFQTMMRLHRWLLGPAKAPDGSIGWGKCLVGISTLLFVVVLATGLVLWWPRTLKGWKAKSKVPFRRGAQALNRGLHYVAGAYLFPLLLLMALTGLTWSFAWYRDGVYALLGCAPKEEKKTTERPAPDASSQGQRKEKGKQDFAWQAGMDRLLPLCSSTSQITLSPGKASVKHFEWGNARAADSYRLDKEGNIVEFEPYAQSDYRRKVSGWLYTLHTGTFAGLLSATLWSLVSLIGAALPLTGYYLWWKRIRRKR